MRECGVIAGAERAERGDAMPRAITSIPVDQASAWSRKVADFSDKIMRTRCWDNGQK
jgi:hypothetical protein